MRFALVLSAAALVAAQTVPAPVEAPVPVPVEAPVPVPVEAPVPAVPVPAVPVPAVPVPAVPVPAVPVPAVPVPAVPVPAVPVPAVPVPAVPVPKAAPSPSTPPADLTPAQLITLLDEQIAATMNADGTVNVAKFNTVIAQINANPMAAAANLLFVDGLVKSKAGFIVGTKCETCNAVNTTTIIGTTPVGCLTGGCAGTRQVNALPIALCGNGLAAQQMACLTQLACEGTITSADKCYVNGAVVSCPSCKKSGSKKGLLGLLGLIGIVPLVLSCCSLFFLCCRKKKTAVPVATFAPIEQVSCVPVGCGTGFNTGFNACEQPMYPTAHFGAPVTNFGGPVCL